ncbi:MAG: hypothetical protein RLZZ08_1023 [Pseudomonadota bacterium]
MLAAAVAVPAMAHGEWQPLLTTPARAEAITPMGFELPGQSFPGSAFYYLSDEPYRPQERFTPAPATGYGALPGTVSGGAAGLAMPAAPLRVIDPGPAARALSLAGTMTDRARAQYCLTLAIYFEAASEPDAGQRAVAQVVLNRVAHPAFPDTVCGVVFQGSDRTTGCQFSFTCDGAMTRKPARMWWDRAAAVAGAALAGAVYQPVGLATHYHTVQVHPYWADSLDNVGTIGAHMFYRWRGKAGLKAAFNERYWGGEPVAAPLPRLATATPVPAPESDPLALARAWESGLVSARQTRAETGTEAIPHAAANPAPRYAAEVQARGGDSLFQVHGVAGAGQVRDEYARSGQWLANP